jgi:hypothetical protein
VAVAILQPLPDDLRKLIRGLTLQLGELYRIIFSRVLSFRSAWFHFDPLTPRPPLPQRGEGEKEILFVFCSRAYRLICLSFLLGSNQLGQSLNPGHSPTPYPEQVFNQTKQSTS